jgi:hypothetical protein
LKYLIATIFIFILGLFLITNVAAKKPHYNPSPTQTPPPAQPQDP